MFLSLSYRWEHALIAATVDAASQQCPNCFLGRTAIQKLLYFMNVLGVPMEYSFDIYHYGPFCQSIMSDVEWLLADEVIEDRAKESRYSNYKPGRGWPELKEEFDNKLNRYRHIVDAVCEALSDLSPDSLELIATLDFSFRWVKARGGKGPWREAAIEKFKSIKKEKFSEQDIDDCYRRLSEVGLIEA